MPMPAHLTLKGEKQGDIKGSCIQKGREGTILVQGLDHEVHIPVDIQTGLATGKRVHGKLKIVKEFDQASPLLYQALVRGEHMNNVEIKWYRISKTGAEEHYFTIRLEDAIICSVRPWVPNCLDKSMATFGHMEDVSFTYKKIIWRHEVDKKEGQDSWEIPGE